uniref:Fatty acid-binding protein, epidermal isoform X2 n=1 Tax=Castor canadensis TaxID=51338 RepID=A0A8B7WFS1_CASCN|nr:fatty acid-binding protein, epidermal isoform X2 [Castor canadensis]
MATLKQMEGRWRLVDSQGFDEYMKELDGLQLHRWCVGAASGVGWKRKHNNEKIERWEISGGVCHEQCHLYSGL